MSALIEAIRDKQDRAMLLHSDAIVAAVIRQTGITRKQILGRDRHENIVWARFLVCHLARLSGFTCKQVGALLGRHHSSILLAVERVAERRSIDLTFDFAVTILENELASPSVP